MSRPVIETKYSFGEWMRARREALGLARKELAARAGCSMQTIRAIEEGAMRPSQAMARALNAHLRVAQEDADAFGQSFVSVARGYQDVDILPPANPLLIPPPSHPSQTDEFAPSQLRSSQQAAPERNRLFWTHGASHKDARTEMAPPRGKTVARLAATSNLQSDHSTVLAYRNRSRMLAKVKTFWIEGVLETSLRGQHTARVKTRRLAPQPEGRTRLAG